MSLFEIEQTEREMGDAKTCFEDIRKQKLSQHRVQETENFAKTKEPLKLLNRVGRQAASMRDGVHGDCASVLMYSDRLKSFP